MPEVTGDVDTHRVIYPEVELIKPLSDGLTQAAVRELFESAQNALRKVCAEVLRHAPESFTELDAKHLLDSLKRLEAGCGAVPR